MKKRIFLYVGISVFCVLAIVLGIIFQVNKDKAISDNQTNIVDNQVEEEPVDNPKDTLAEFNSLFKNTIDTQSNSTENVKKLEGFEDKEIVFTAYDIKEEEYDQYSINVKLPVINIDSEIANSKLNGITQTVFADKTTSVLQGTTRYTIYNVEYIAYLNDNILSLVIKSTLKEGNSAQRVIVQTYNYDIVEDREVTLNEILTEQGYDTWDVNKKIDQQVTEASKQAETIAQATGQVIYKRIVSDSMYTTDNASNFFIGKNGQIYIVYAYGNNNSTSEIDIIKV